MSEKSQLDLYEELLAEYGVSPFQLALNLYFHDETCSKAIADWKDTWEFCPVCGGDILNNGVVNHTKYKMRPC